jgi:hypothetical protein
VTSGSTGVALVEPDDAIGKPRGASGTSHAPFVEPTVASTTGRAAFLFTEAAFPRSGDAIGSTNDASGKSEAPSVEPTGASDPPDAAFLEPGDAFLEPNVAVGKPKDASAKPDAGSEVPDVALVIADAALLDLLHAVVQPNATGGHPRDTLEHPGDWFTTSTRSIVMPASTTKIVHRARVSLKLPDKVADLIAFAIRVVDAMTSNPAFPTPAPALAVLTAAITTLQNAETAALKRTTGAVTARNEKRAELIALLQQEQGYVQTVADATPESGASIIESAGVAVRKTPVHAARAFAAKQGTVSGAAKITAVVAARRASYEWQYSTDGGKTWVAAPGTLKATTTVTGLPVGTPVQFRYRALTKAGEGDWSQAVVLVVK